MSSGLQGEEVKPFIKSSISIVLISVLLAVWQAPLGQAISRGKIEVGSKFVVALLFDQFRFSSCSGALITSDIVVTAAHCVFKTKYIQEPSGLKISYPGSALRDPAVPRLLEVSKVLLPPTFVGETDIPYSFEVDDIAFLFLKEPIPDFETVKIADSTLVNRIKSEGYEIKHYGYGVQKDIPFTHDGNPYSVIQRATNLQNVMARNAKNERVLYTNGTIPGFAICQGDSGGPGYVTLNGITYLVSVNSAAGGCDSSTHPSSTFSTVIFPHMEFLQYEYQLYTSQKAAAELKAKQKAEAKAAADLKAKQEAEAEAAADLKAKQTAEAKAAADLKAKQTAEAKAAADLKAKQKAEAKAAADLKAKQEAEAKAVATKKTTITCVKGKLTKKVTAVKPKCPTEPRKVIGTVSAAEFVVAVAAFFGFLAQIGRIDIDWSIVGGLALGGTIAAPFAAKLVGILPATPLGIVVAVAIIILNAIAIIRA
jgi:hypothetical protein